MPCLVTAPHNACWQRRPRAGAICCLRVSLWCHMDLRHSTLAHLVVVHRIYELLICTGQCILLAEVFESAASTKFQPTKSLACRHMLITMT